MGTQPLRTQHKTISKMTRQLAGHLLMAQEAKASHSAAQSKPTKNARAKNVGTRPTYLAPAAVFVEACGANGIATEVGAFVEMSRP